MPLASFLHLASDPTARTDLTSQKGVAVIPIPREFGKSPRKWQVTSLIASYFPSVAWNSSFMRFQESWSAFLSYFMPGLFALSAVGTVKLWTTPG